MPRIIQQRSLIVVLGPEGSGKTSVARRLAGPDALYLDTRETQNRLVEQVARGRWADDLLEAPALVLDGPIWLRRRVGAVDAIAELLRARHKTARRTLVVQCDRDASIDEVVKRMEPGSLVVIGLRFPKGQRGKLRFARNLCDDLRLPRRAARGTEDLDNWAYKRVMMALAEYGDGEGEGEGDE